MITYQKLFNNPAKFLRFTGFDIFQFKVLSSRLRPLWEEEELKRLSRKNRIRAIGGGRKYHLSTIEDKLLLILIFYRTYCIYEILGWMFNLDPSNICRLIKKLTPLVEKAADPSLRLAFKIIRHKRKRLGFEEFIRTYPDIVELVIDSTEQKRRRPKNKKKQKNFYSGKKHQHGLKTQIIVTRSGKIISISKTYPARVHDKTVLLKEKTLDKLPQEIKILLDKGYKKIEKIYPHHRIVIPIKRSRWKKTLERKEKIRNTKLARKRVVIEHTICQLKKYQILSQVYRSKEEDYNKHFRNIAALYNFKLNFKQIYLNPN